MSGAWPAVPPVSTVLLILSLAALLLGILAVWQRHDRRYRGSESVAEAYDRWTQDQLLERLWGDHVHLGHYGDPPRQRDFRAAKADFVHELVRWSGLDRLPPGSRVLDVGCGIGGSARILARDYGLEVLGISISPAQIARARELTPPSLQHCRFAVMDALALELPDADGAQGFDAVWSVEAGPHMPDKQRYADELLRVLRFEPLADPVVTPPGSEPFYSERVVRLPGCYQPNDRQRRIAEATPGRREAGLPENGSVFCCFNNNYKLLASQL